MNTPGTADRPLRVAIVGSGPSGFYAADALLKAPGLQVRVDVFDRLPTPYGLVRGGVAPDHQKIKAVIALYEKVALDPRVRFFGNVKLGRDLSVDDLRARYDQIVYAVGCESDRHMGIPGEELGGSHSATEFVGWYNAHPDHQDHEFDLSCSAA
ncbi:MAG: FAD/NAD(P)-binding protein, partial [Elusimicrobia bacterium]|nr:FAD/NAD(P)-binding protein [Elusimicrobiota bacterium]